MKKQLIDRVDNRTKTPCNNKPANSQKRKSIKICFDARLKTECVNRLNTKHTA